MTNSTTDNDALKNQVRKMAFEGKPITYISKKLGITWSQARSYTPGWIGTKKKLTIRLNKLVTETDAAKREKLAAEADQYADFLFDAAKHLRGQVDAARRALTR